MNKYIAKINKVKNKLSKFPNKEIEHVLDVLSNNGTDFSPVMPKRGICTRSMYTIAQESYRKHPM